MEKYKVEFSRRANLQIHNIFAYISEDNSNAALKVIDALEAKAIQLGRSPFIGIELSNDEYPFLPLGYRKVVVKPFVMYYRIIDQTVYITHIVHSKRNQTRAILEEE